MERIKEEIRNKISCFSKHLKRNRGGIRNGKTEH